MGAASNLDTAANRLVGVVWDPPLSTPTGAFFHPGRTLHVCSDTGDAAPSHGNPNSDRRGIGWWAYIDGAKKEK